MKKIIPFLFASFAASSLMAQDAATPKKYNDNLLSIAPISIVDKGLGISLVYERMLDKEQKVAFTLPFEYVFDDMGESDYMSNDFAYKLNYFYINPGITIYPAGLKRVNYGIGANLVMGFGSGGEWRYNDLGFRSYEEYNNFRMGVMLNNYLQFNVTNKFTMQLNLGMGIRYINSYTFDNNSHNDYKRGTSPMGQFKFVLGYRF